MGENPHRTWSLTAEALHLFELKLTQPHLWSKPRNVSIFIPFWKIRGRNEHRMAISAKDFGLFLKFNRIILIIGPERYLSS